MSCCWAALTASAWLPCACRSIVHGVEIWLRRSCSCCSFMGRSARAGGSLILPDGGREGTGKPAAHGPPRAGQGGLPGLSFWAPPWLALPETAPLALIVPPHLARHLAQPGNRSL